MSALKHAWREGLDAAQLAGDRASAWRLRADFMLSRMLSLGQLPGYNAERTVRLKDGTTLHYRFNRGDLQSLREVWVDEVYACELPFEVRTVLDLGANIGLASIWLARRAQGGQTQSNPVKPMQILAVEPVPANAEVVRANFELNQVSGEVVGAAVGQQTGHAWFEQRTESNLGRLLDHDMPGALPVPVVGIRDLLSRFPEGRVDLVKMDIEGAEAKLLGSDTDWLSRVKALMVEWHDDRADSCPLIRNVEGAGFRHVPINIERQDNLSLFLRY
jgi:FkbM family methyltransferase